MKVIQEKLGKLEEDCVVLLDKTLYSHDAEPSNQVHKWELANVMLGLTL